MFGFLPFWNKKEQKRTARNPRMRMILDMGALWTPSCHPLDARAACPCRTPVFLPPNARKIASNQVQKADIAPPVPPPAHCPCTVGIPGRLFILIIRSYQGENTGSHPNSEVKHPWACSVLRWGTTRESQVTNVFDFEPPRPQRRKLILTCYSRIPLTPGDSRIRSFCSGSRSVVQSGG